MKHIISSLMLISLVVPIIETQASMVANEKCSSLAQCSQKLSQPLQDILGDIMP